MSSHVSGRGVNTLLLTCWSLHGVRTLQSYAHACFHRPDHHIPPYHNTTARLSPQAIPPYHYLLVPYYLYHLPAVPNYLTLLPDPTAIQRCYAHACLHRPSSPNTSVARRSSRRAAHASGASARATTSLAPGRSPSGTRPHPSSQLLAYLPQSEIRTASKPRPTVPAPTVSNSVDANPTAGGGEEASVPKAWTMALSNAAPAAAAAGVPGGYYTPRPRASAQAELEAAFEPEVRACDVQYV